MARNLREKAGVVVWMLNEENASKGSTELNLSMLYVDQGHSLISYIVSYDMNITMLLMHFCNNRYFSY